MPQRCCLTYGRDHSDGEVKGAGEFPLQPGFVRLELQHHLLQLVEIIRGQVVELLEQLLFLRFQLPLLGRLLLRLQRVEDRGADDQVGEGADDEGEGPHVLPLHGAVVRVRGTGGESARVWRTGSSAGSWLCAALTEQRSSLITL